MALNRNERGECGLSKITLDIDKCYNYTAQIQQLNRRIKELDKDIYDLYDEIGWGNHKYLRQVDGTVSYSKKLEKCGSYLSDVGSEFNRVDNENYLSDISELSEYRNISWIVSLGSLMDKLGYTGKNYGSSIGEMTENTINIIKEYMSSKIGNYVDKFDSFESWSDMVVGWYDWFNDDLYGDFDTAKGWLEDILEEQTGVETKLLPKSVSDFMDNLSDGQILIDVVKAAKEYKNTGDAIDAFDDVAFSFFGKLVKEGHKYINKTNKVKYVGVAGVVEKILFDTIIEMPKNWYEGVKDYIENGTGTAGSIVVESTVGAFVEVVADTAIPSHKAATALTYPVVDQVCETFGYDLSGEYERLTGETGINAVFKAQKELWVDIVYEGAKEKAAEAVDGFYATVSKGWESWKSGVSLIFGRK